MKRTTLFLIASLLVPFAYGQEPILLEEYTPQSIYKIPVTKVEKAKYPVIDAHSHDYPTSREDVAQWVKTMDSKGIEKTVILTGYTGASFDSIVEVYAPYKDRFDLWCGLDLSDYGKPTFVETAVNELIRCHAKGAKGVGEVTDKGLGVYVAFQTNMAKGVHLNDPLMSPIYETCAKLGMPLNIHVAEPYWMYLPDDKYNDGLMNGRVWKIDKSIPGMQTHEQLIAQFEEAVKNHPNTLFVACHFINCSYDLSITGGLLDKYPNLYVDISARFGETGSIPRYMKKFYTRYADRILYGTDNGMSAEMYEVTFRILETDDEHFYIPNFQYHWNLSGFDLPDEVLRNVYRENFLRIMK